MFCCVWKRLITNTVNNINVRTSGDFGLCETLAEMYKRAPVAKRIETKKILSSYLWFLILVSNATGVHFYITKIDRNWI